MKLERLEIARLQGFSTGFCLQNLASDINLITGPNAIGKSSLVRALRLLLGKPDKADPLVTLAAEFSEGDVRWRVDRMGQEIEWKRNGAPVAHPNLPGAEQIGRYWLSMEDLVKADATDASLAQELQRELCGGFDLDAVRTYLGPRHGTSDRNKFDDARKSVLEAERHADALHKRQQAIPELEANICRARQAKEQVRLIGQAKQLLKAMRASKDATSRIAMFPENMDKITGQELERIEQLNLRLEASQEAQKEQQRALQQAQASLKDSGLAVCDLDKAGTDLNVLEQILHGIKDLLKDQKERESDQRQQEAAVHTASGALGGDAAPNLTEDTLGKAEGFARDFLKLREEANQLEQRIAQFGEPPDEREVRNHHKGVDALRDWLTAQSQQPNRRQIAAPLWISLLLAIAIIPGFFLLPPLMPAALALPLFLALVWALWKLRSSSGNEAQQIAARQFEETGIVAPTWNPAAVRARLKEIEENLARMEARRHMAEGAEAARARLTSIGKQILEKQEDRKRLNESLGFNPLLPVTALDRFIGLAKDWEKAQSDLEITNRKLSDVERGLQEALEKGKGILARWQEDVPETIDQVQLSAEYEAFKHKLERAREASRAVKIAERLGKDKDIEIAQHEQDVARVYRDAGLREAEHHRLIECVQEHESWKSARAQLTEAETLEKQFRSELQGEEALMAILDSGDESALDEHLKAKEQLAARLEELRNERAEAESEIRHAETHHALQDAIAKRKDAEVNLEQKRDELLANRATELLLRQVEQAYRATHEPEVLRQANALFQQVTANAFELRLGDSDGFQAWNTQQGTLCKLEELSTGTRMQLLLAVRVAWVQSQCQDGRMLPLFLDEALTTSDENRFMIVARSLDQISRTTGIQVIYLSARRHEHHLWRTALRRDPHRIDLAALRGQAVDESHEFSVTPPEPIPAPEGDAVEYAKRLGVPSVHPALDPGEIHLFHILRDDLDRLHEFMQTLRIASLGQLESYLCQGIAIEHQGDTHTTYLLERCRAARAWVSAWQEGRGRPVSALELEVSGAFSPVFMRRARALANSKDISGDASSMLTALRRGALKGFQTKKIDDFENWLTEHRYLDDRAVLSRDERRQRVLQTYGLDDQERLQDIGRCIDWLEAGFVDLDGAA